MEIKKLAALINRIHEITAADEYAMDFFPGATVEEISAFEQEQALFFLNSCADGCVLRMGAVCLTR